MIVMLTFIGYFKEKIDLKNVNNEYFFKNTDIIKDHLRHSLSDAKLLDCDLTYHQLNNQLEYELIIYIDYEFRDKLLIETVEKTCKKIMNAYQKIRENNNSFKVKSVKNVTAKFEVLKNKNMNLQKNKLLN
jgi:hypothetical protein